jgi:hypothetical protein
MPRRVRLLPALSQVSRDHGSEMVHPTPNRLIRHRHSAFRQQIFDVAAEGEPEVEPNCLVDDLGWETIPTVADFLHAPGYRATIGTASPTRVPPRGSLDVLVMTACVIVSPQDLKDGAERKFFGPRGERALDYLGVEPAQILADKRLGD